MATATEELNELIAVRDIPNRVPTRPSLATCWRWVRGVTKGRALESHLIGGRRFVTSVALREFCGVDLLPGEDDAED